MSQLKKETEPTSDWRRSAGMERMAAWGQLQGQEKQCSSGPCANIVYVLSLLGCLSFMQRIIRQEVLRMKEPNSLVTRTHRLFGNVRLANLRLSY